jgi:dTDP-4-dehydrorhamnose 3,5-epimerase
MGKLIRVTKGQALLVARNVHPNSPHFGTAYGVELTEEDLVWVWAPGWYARGYLALAEGTEVHYKCTAEYDSRTERAIRWSDPSMNIDWPVVQPIVSDRDRNAPTLDEALREGLLDFPPVEL